MDLFGVSKIRYFRLVSLLVSMFIMAFMVDFLWGVFLPATLFSKTLFLLLNIVLGLVLFKVLNAFFAVLAVALFFFFFKKRVGAFLKQH